jgi:hypothetical protein
MAADDTTEMQMFYFDNISKRIIGKSCTSLLALVTDTLSIPPDLGAIVSLKLTFVVVYNQMSFQDLEKTHQVSHSFTWKRPILATNQIEHSSVSVN